MTTTDKTGTVYTGPAGQTQSRFAIYNCRCGNRFATEIFTSIDVSERPDLVHVLMEGNLNRGTCSSCGATVVVDSRCVLHDPTRHLLVLFLPEKERHAELEARSQLLAELSRDPSGALPAYVVDFQVAFGPDGLREVLERGSRLPADGGDGAPANELARVREQIEVDRKDLGEWSERLRRQEADLGAKLSEVEARSREVEEFARGIREAGSAPRPAGRFPREASEQPRRSPWFTGQFEVSQPTLEKTIEQALPGHDPGDARAVSEEDVVEEASIVSEEAILEDRTLPPDVAHARSAQPRPAPASKPVDARKPGKLDEEVLEALETPAKRHARLVGDQVDLFAVTTEASLLDAVKRSSVRFRVHLVDDATGYPWTVLTAAVRPPGREIYLFRWMLDYKVRSHRRILGRLAEKCQAHVTLVSASMERNVTFVARNRIEGNVKSLASDLERFFLENPTLDSPSEVDEPAVIDTLLAELRKPFPFHSRYVEEHATASGLLEAIADLDAWSSPANRTRLIRIYSFPLEGIASIKRRVVSRAVELGLDLPGDLPEDAVSMGLADDDAALVSHSLRAFAAMLRGEHDLGEEQIAGNFRKLADAALARGLAIELEVAEIAVDHLRPLGGDLSFAAEVAVLDSTPLADLEREVLERWLYRPSRRSAAALELLGRGDPEVVPRVLEAVHAMEAQDLLEVIPRILSAAEDEGEGFFTDALRSGRSELRLASVLALGKLRLRSAIVPLLNAMCEHDEPDWKVECFVLARYGAAAMRTVEQFLRNPHGCDEKLSYLVAALASAGCEGQVRDLTGETDLMVAELAKQGLKMKHTVERQKDEILGADTDDPLLLFVRSLDTRLAGD